MSAQPEPLPGRHLHIIDGDTGEALDGCPACAMKDDIIEGLERDIRAWTTRYANLQRDKEKESREDPLWPEALRLFRLYCRLTGKDGKPRRLTWNAERFETVRPHLKRHGIGLCERAIVGRVFDHYVSKRRNGSEVHYWEWDRIFGAAGKGSAAENFEESARRAPTDFVSELETEDQAREQAKVEEMRAKREGVANAV